MRGQVTHHAPNLGQKFRQKRPNFSRGLARSKFNPFYPMFWLLIAFWVTFSNKSQLLQCFSKQGRKHSHSLGTLFGARLGYKGGGGRSKNFKIEFFILKHVLNHSESISKKKVFWNFLPPRPLTYPPLPPEGGGVKNFKNEFFILKHVLNHSESISKKKFFEIFFNTPL